MHKWFTTHAACLLNCTKSLSCVVIRVFGLSSLCRDTYVPDGAQGFYTTHTQYINVENNVDTSVERGAFSIQWGCWFVFIIRILDTPFRMFHREFTYIGIVILIALSKLSQHNMHGQGPCDKRRLLSCPIPYQLRSHPIYIQHLMRLWDWFGFPVPWHVYVGWRPTFLHNPYTIY